MSDPGILRRLLLVVLVLIGTAAASRLLASILASDGLSIGEVAILLLFTLTFAWIAIAFCTALAGFLRLVAGSGLGGGLRGPDRGAPLTTRTALVMPLYHEDVLEVEARLAAIHRSLERTGELTGFDLFVLSDSRDPAIIRAEEAMWARLRLALGRDARLFYRRRADNGGRKSGNIAEFCRRWGGRYDFFVVLDADSVMTGETLVRLARLMEANPQAGLIQTVPQPVRGRTLFARVQQFAARLYGPLYALGTAFWYPGTSNYWGHNAIIRTRAFTACCGLPSLSGRPPFGGEILSHDFVEAALLQRGGWQVWLVPELGGSFEELPPTLDDYAARDRRWCQGNLQHTRLLALKGLRPVSRGHLALGVMSYVASPLWLSLLLLTTFEAVRTDGAEWVYFPEASSLFPAWPISRAMELLGLFSVTMGMLLAPKLLALGMALVRPDQRRAFGGGPSLIKSVVAEVLFAALLAPVLMIQQSLAVLGTLLGRRVGWGGQRRGEHVQTWLEVARSYAPVTAVGLAWGALAWQLAPGLLVWLSPVLAGMVLSIPLAALSGRPAIGQAARRHGWFLTPEEGRPPLELVASPAPQPRLLQPGERPEVPAEAVTSR
jgi:membrane glycosyltransferase